MSDENLAKQVRRGERYIELRGRLQSVFNVLNQIKENIANDRAQLVLDFGPGSPEVQESDDLWASVQQSLNTYASRY